MKFQNFSLSADKFRDIRRRNAQKSEIIFVIRAVQIHLHWRDQFSNMIWTADRTLDSDSVNFLFIYAIVFDV